MSDIRMTEEWKMNVRNADYCIKHHLPYEMFLCTLGEKYKQIIWNERLSILRAYFI